GPDDPADAEAAEAVDLREASDGDQVLAERCGRLLAGSEGVVEVDLADDDGRAAVAGDLADRHHLLGAGRDAGRVVGVGEDDRAGRPAGLPLQLLELDLPPAVEAALQRLDLGPAGLER